MNFVSFLEAWELSDKSSIRYAVSDFEGTKLVVKILDPAVFSQPIFKSVASGILMSGTLYPPEMYADILGLDRNNTNFAKYSSPFLEENRLVTIDKSVTTSYAQRNLDMYYKIAVQIHRTAELVPGNVAVFFTSYDLLNSISKLLEQHPLKKPVLMERRELSAKAKSGILRELQVQKSEGEGALLLAVMGGSMAEGVDYPGNLLSGIMVVGIPLAPPSLELSALSSYFGGKFGDDKRDDYCSNLPAMNKVLQAAGRSIRSETDKSIIIFMDRRFNMQKYRKYFPDEYRITGDDFGSILKDFF